MKGNKQRRAEIKAKRLKRKVEKPTLTGGESHKELPTGTAPCNPKNLAPYGHTPKFVERGHYLDMLFRCTSCGKQEVWHAAQQKWWYEVAKGNVKSYAKLCRSCRRMERKRKATARKVHLEGLEAKRNNQSVKKD